MHKNFKQYEIKQGDCLELMRELPDKSIDLVLTDLPYGVTDCEWDKVLPFCELWHNYNRIVKERGAMVFTAQQPFTTLLINSNKKYFKYCWYWLKNQTTGFAQAKHQPLRCVEDIVVFYRKKPTYNPQGLVKLQKPIHRTRKETGAAEVYGIGSLNKNSIQHYTNYPRQTLNIKCQRDGLHPTQKPVELMEYLIKTYTNEGDVVLDNCMGSGTTGVAAINTKRRFIGYELNPQYFTTAAARLEKLIN